MLIGVTDSGRIVGQDVTDNTKREIAREINKIEPSASVEVDYVEVENNKFVIVIRVDKGVHAPYTYDARPYQRDESNTTRMSQHRYEQLLVRRGQQNHSWELSIADGYSVDDLDHNEIHLAVKQGIAAGRVPAEAANEPIESILKSWKLIEGGQINNAAVALFAKDVLPRYPQCHIKLGRFRGADMLGNMIDNKELYGNAFQIFAEANSFIMRHLPIASFFQPDRFERIDKPALPVLAVREALVNAVCHRDYSNRSASITLAIFDDRLEIWNNGKLPPSLSIDDLQRKHKSEPRNKIISNVFYDRKYFDGWGTGINKIFDLCRENDVPEPKYDEYSGGVEITFRFKEPIAAYEIVSPVQILTARQQEILSLFRQYHSLTTKQVENHLPTPPALRTIQGDLQILKEYGLVYLQGRGNKVIWILK